MSLVNPMSQMRPEDYKGVRFVGTVVDNVDPDGLHRVRVQIEHVFDGVINSDLPWAVPEDIDAFGASPNGGKFGPPDIGTKVYVVFQMGDPHFPMYKGRAYTADTKIDIAGTNYPNRVGWSDHGHHFFYDRSTGEMELEHKSGTVFHIDGSGNLTITVVEGVTAKVDQNVSLTVTGSTTVNSTGDVSVTTSGKASVSSTGDTDITAQGNVSISSSGTTTINSTGGATNIESSTQVALTAPSIKIN